jgi:hypothetical protein
MVTATNKLKHYQRTYGELKPTAFTVDCAHNDNWGHSSTIEIVQSASTAKVDEAIRHQGGKKRKKRVKTADHFETNDQREKYKEPPYYCSL